MGFFMGYDWEDITYTCPMIFAIMNLKSSAFSA